jgi:hypothetical protein
MDPGFGLNNLIDTPGFDWNIIRSRGPLLMDEGEGCSIPLVNLKLWEMA